MLQCSGGRSDVSDVPQTWKMHRNGSLFNHGHLREHLHQNLEKITQAVDELRSRGEDLVRIGAVDTDNPPYHFQLFLNEDATTVIACLGVDQSWNP